MVAPKDHLTGDAGFPVKVLRGILTVGATGAVTSFAGYGIISCTRIGTGDYKLVLDGAYSKLLFAQAVSLNASIDDIMVSVKAEDVDDATTPYVELYTYSVGGSASDPASGSLIYFKIEVQDTAA